MRIPTIHSTPAGLVDAVNQRRLKEIPYFLLTDSPNNIVTIPANSQRGPVSMTISQDGPAEIVSFACQAAGAALILPEIDDGSNVFALANVPIHIGCIVGSGIAPYILPQSLNIDELRKLRITLTDISGASNAVRFVAQCYRPCVAVPDPKMEKARTRLSPRQFLTAPYFYAPSAGRIALTAGSSSEVSIDLDKERHFRLMQLSSVSTGNYTVDVLNGMTGESLLDAPQAQHYQIPNTMLFGNNNYPLKFDRGRMFQKGQKLIVRVTDTSAAPNNIYLAFAGQFISSKMWEA